MKEIVQFINGVKSELSKVIWPKWDDFLGSTVIVLFLVAVFALYLFGLDSILSWGAGYIFERYGAG